MINFSLGQLRKLYKKLNRRWRHTPNYLTVPDLLSVQEKFRLKTMPNLYGLLMMRGDLDILEEVLACNSPFFKAIFVLDGTDDWRASERILRNFSIIMGIFHDKDLPGSYHRPPRDGARQVLLEAIQNDYGYDGYIVLLHSDEMLYDFPPTLLALAMENHRLDALSVNNVHFFLHASMRENYTYNPNLPVINQVRHACFPGYPEFRIFRNKPGLYYQINEHGRVIPHGLGSQAKTNFPLRHYLYRSPEQMQQNAIDRDARGWQAYGANWMENKSSGFVDCLPGYEFVKFIPANTRIINGETGAVESNTEINVTIQEDL